MMILNEQEETKRNTIEIPVFESKIVQSAEEKTSATMKENISRM